MAWWRARRKGAAWLATCALLLQIALSFAHIHPEDFAGLGSGLAGAAQAITTLDQTGGGPDDRGTAPGHDDCAICATVHLAGALLLPAPPSVDLPRTTDRIAWACCTEFRLAADAKRLFRSRAPPTT